MTPLLAVSITETVALSTFETYTRVPSDLATTESGVWSTGIVATICLVFTSTTDTVSDAPLATYARLPTTTTPVGSDPVLADVVVPDNGAGDGAALLTVTGAEVVMLPAASRATAV